MNILRAILVGLASFIFIVAVSGYVYVLTLQTTVMDRTVVKNWLSESQLYDGRIISALVQATNAGGGQNGAPQPPANALNPSPEAIKTALNAAFTSDFTQTQIEGVVNNAYNWIDGTSPEFTFSIPIDQKRDVLITELSKAIEPQISALPVCQASQFTQQSTCRPSNITVEQLASQLTTQSIDESGAFAKPITHESFSAPNQSASQHSEQTTLSQLPAIRKGIDILLLALPIAAAISLVIIILATLSGHRLARIARLSRRIFFGMLFIFLPAIIVVWMAKDNDFGLSNMFAAQTGELVIPLIKTIAVGTLAQLALISGIVGGVGVVAWILLSILQRKIPTPQVATPAPMTAPVATPTAPAQYQPQPSPETTITTPENTDNKYN